MKMEVTSDLDNMTIRYTITISGSDWAKAKFYPMDRVLLDECERSERLSDKLLGLETIVRRIEQTDTKNHQCAKMDFHINS